MEELAVHGSKPDVEQIVRHLERRLAEIMRARERPYPEELNGKEKPPDEGQTT